MNLDLAIGLLILVCIIYFALVAWIAAVAHSVNETRERLDSLAPKIKPTPGRPPRLTDTRADFERARARGWKD